MPVDEVGRVVVLPSVRLLQPAEQVLEDMFTGWRNQQLSRNLAFATIDGRERLVRRFVDHSQAWPWTWTHQHVDEFFADLVQGRRHTTVRAYQNALRLFCAYVAHPDYGWDRMCESLFGSHPSQVVFEWNAAVHAQVGESDPRKRAFTKQELQAFFDRADDEVDRIFRALADATRRDIVRRTLEGEATVSATAACGLLTESEGSRVRPVRGRGRALRKGAAGVGTEAPRRVDRVRLVGRRRRPVDPGGTSPLRRRRHGPVPFGTTWGGRRRDRRPVPPLPRRPRSR